jgi:hypothetical protein
MIPDEVVKVLPKKLEEYTDDHTKTNGIYSHSTEGKRWYNIEFNQGYNQAIADFRKGLSNL